MFWPHRPCTRTVNKEAHTSDVSALLSVQLKDSPRGARTPLRKNTASYEHPWDTPWQKDTDPFRLTHNHERDTRCSIHESTVHEEVQGRSLVHLFS